MSSPHDEIGVQPEWSDEDKAQFEHLDYLIHQTFAQTDSGKELLEIWHNNLIERPIDSSGIEPFFLGKEEGVKTFIRNIMLTVRKVENE